MSMVGGNETKYTGQEENVDYDEAAIGGSKDSGETYPYFWEWNGASQLNFPVMNFDK